MNGVKKTNGVITSARNEINLLDKNDTKDGMSKMVEIENKMKRELMRQEVTKRSAVIEEKTKIDSVELTRELKEEIAHLER